MILGIIQQQHYLWTHLTGNPESAGSVAPGGGGGSLCIWRASGCADGAASWLLTFALASNQDWRKIQESTHDALQVHRWLQGTLFSEAKPGIISCLRAL